MVHNRPFIALSASGSNPETPGGFRKLECSTAYTHAIALAGGIPGLLCEEEPEAAASLYDALLLTGGGDLEPSLFGETMLNDTVNVDSIRDAFELPLVRAFIAAGKPVMGICRGAQVINVALGGTLYQDLREQLGFVHSDSRLRHFVNAEEGSVLHCLFGARFRVNSTHHQAVRDLGSGLHVTARSPEGIIEAFEHESLPILATQFHPERLTGLTGEQVTPDFLPLFEHFVALCRGNAARTPRSK